VRVVAHVHDRLGRRDGHVLVDAGRLLEDLIADLRVSTAYLRPVGLFVEAEQHMMSVNRASAVGLIVNELVTNALKHAFPGDRQSGGMGRRLVRALAAQLGGRVETSQAEPSGTIYTVRFPVNAPGSHDAGI
jgi:two-component sensor histidine kinase